MSTPFQWQSNTENSRTLFLLAMKNPKCKLFHVSRPKKMNIFCQSAAVLLSAVFPAGEPPPPDKDDFPA